MRDRLPHADIVQRLARHVEEQRPGPAGAAKIEDHVGLLLLRLANQPGTAAPSIMSTSPLTKASVRAAVSVRYSTSSRSIFGLPPQYWSNARSDDFLFRLVADELERPAADRVVPQLVAQLLDGLAALNVAAEARHQGERMEERIGLAADACTTV